MTMTSEWLLALDAELAKAEGKTDSVCALLETAFAALASSETVASTAEVELLRNWVVRRTSAPDSLGRASVALVMLAQGAEFVPSEPVAVCEDWIDWVERHPEDESLAVVEVGIAMCMSSFRRCIRGLDDAARPRCLARLLRCEARLRARFGNRTSAHELIVDTRELLNQGFA
jgi:hypothetical protein